MSCQLCFVLPVHLEDKREAETVVAIACLVVQYIPVEANYLKIRPGIMVV